MNASILVDLYEAQEEQRRALVVVRTGENQYEKDQAQRTLPALGVKIQGLQEQLWNSYTPSFVRCRDIGHVWDVTTETVENDVYRRLLTCYRCGTTRADDVNSSGDLDRRGYKHASDYLMPKGVGGAGTSKAFWRGISYLVASRKTQ